MDGTGDIDTTGATVADVGDIDTGDQDQPRDFEAEARQHGWTPKDGFKGDAAKWVDAETFVKRADEVMPFLKKQNVGLKREIEDLKKQIKQASAHFSKAEERAYNRALAELDAKHTEAVESGDVAGARKVVKDMEALKAEAVEQPAEEKPEDAAKTRREFTAWVEANDWYVLDDKKRAYADLQADTMGPATEWEGGQQAWLAEIKRRTDKRFAEPKPNPVNGGGNRSAPSAGGKTWNDLPPAAKALADKWVKSGLLKSRDEYVASYDWS